MSTCHAPMEANTIDELLIAIRSIGNQGEDELWYRGQSKFTWGLAPSIQRVAGPEMIDDIERGLANDFYVRASHIVNDSPPRDNFAPWLTTMQHYGVPTRLLDWSRSPLIAAFFAVEQDADYDACVWVLRPKRLNARGGHTSCLHPLDSHTASAMMQTAFISREDDWIKDRDILACYGVGKDPRVYTQQSCFTIHRDRQVRLDDFDGHPEFADIVFRIRVSAEGRRVMRDQLEMVGITPGFVYPDFEHIASDLRVRYGLG